MNHMAPGRMMLRQLDNKIANEYLTQTIVKGAGRNDGKRNAHEDSSSYPVVKHSCQRSLEEVCSPGDKRGGGEQPNSAKVQDDTTA